jgi:signal transduction histidine kinase
MKLTVKSKILMTVLSVVLMFALFILFYFPERQERYLIENFNDEIENFAKTVALGVKIALTEQNFEGVETAIDFVRSDERLEYVSLILTDSASAAEGGKFVIRKTVFKTYPDSVEVDLNAVSNDQFIIKSAPFSTPMMSGEIILSFSTDEIVESRNQIRFASLLASLIVFIIGLSIGFWLARNISKPVLALRDAANKVGEGDLTQSVTNRSRDEIGELGIAFNKMVKDLSIEAALERVRTKAMAMQHSNDLVTTIASVLRELAHIGLASEYSGLGIIDGQEKKADFWTSSNPDGGKEALQKGAISLSGHPFLEGMMYSWENQEPHTYILQGEDYARYYKMFEATGVQLSEDSMGESSSSTLQFCYTAMFPAGALTIFRSKTLEEEKVPILQRFADVFHLAITRHNDLKNSEASAREEAKQGSLDRVRGEISSMRTKEDLMRITPLVWKELTFLNVPFIRCGVFIVDESKSSIRSYLSSPEGNSLGVFNLHSHTNEIAKKLIIHWRSKTAYTEHWDKAQFIAFTQSMIEQGKIENQQAYQGTPNPPESLHLHFVPFKQGMLYAGNTAPLSIDELQLVQSLAKAFSIAYARYEDFTQLEEAKDKMELTLSELKSTQSQLIQSEKMASLGELTAGIAHEIQNPLNFVNNFSEVSEELLTELKEELEKGDVDEAKEISNDVIQNLQKILHHGQRASGIVKGMLEHSRSGDGVKELTDINTLADKFLHLAYHGLRAKNKSFNADFKTEFDESLPKITVVSQDIGRVLLNLINNAFYAVNERAKNEGDDYKPLVTITTTNIPPYQGGTKGGVEITVTDNGSGIPEQNRDKIFQPFFTTKATGEGTGLGLSLSYDIVTKGHLGGLRVESKEGIGSTFIIKLPV